MFEKAHKLGGSCPRHLCKQSWNEVLCNSELEATLISEYTDDDDCWFLLQSRQPQAIMSENT
jgi:hypothetical protein